MDKKREQKFTLLALEILKEWNTRQINTSVTVLSWDLGVLFFYYRLFQTFWICHYFIFNSPFQDINLFEGRSQEYAWERWGERLHCLFMKGVASKNACTHWGPKNRNHRFHWSRGGGLIAPPLITPLNPFYICLHFRPTISVYLPNYMDSRGKLNPALLLYKQCE